MRDGFGPLLHGSDVGVNCGSCHRSRACRISEYLLGGHLIFPGKVRHHSSESLIRSCAFHLVYGRLSDIFGRKIVLQTAIGILCLGNLLCGFARTPIYLYVFRALAGVGGGGVVGIAMVIVR